MPVARSICRVMPGRSQVNPERRSVTDSAMTCFQVTLITGGPFMTGMRSESVLAVQLAKDLGSVLTWAGDRRLLRALRRRVPHSPRTTKLSSARR